MEEKIFSRAATKTSLSDLVIDAKNIDRLFSRREMDLLQVNTFLPC
jgi:SNF2 family DNA or RNA helicase